MPNPLEGVDILDPRAVALYFVSFVGVLIWMNFFSDAVRNWRTNEYDQNANPFNAWVAGWMQKLSPLAIQSVVFFVDFAFPALMLALLVFVFKTVQIASFDDAYGYIITWGLAYLQSIKRYQEIKRSSLPFIEGEVLYAEAAPVEGKG